MALSKKIQIENNFGETSVFPNCYIKVGVITGTKKDLSFSVVFFSEKDGTFLESRNLSFAPSMSDKNFIAQSYEHLKTLPEFAGATDC
jgi:hypothetical protein